MSFVFCRIFSFISPFIVAGRVTFATTADYERAASVSSPWQQCHLETDAKVHVCRLCKDTFFAALVTKRKGEMSIGRRKGTFFLSFTSVHQAPRESRAFTVRALRVQARRRCVFIENRGNRRRFVFVL